MKKIFAAALIGTMVLSLSACGGETATQSSENVIDKAAESIVSESSSSAESQVEAQSSGQSVEETNSPDFSGTYTEPATGRCAINIEALGNNNYKINIHWSSSAFESANWEMTATYYDSTTLLEYTDAKYFVRTYTSEEEYTDDVVYTNGAGEFWFESDGSLGWRSANSDVDYVTGETLFEKVELITE